MPRPHSCEFTRETRWEARQRANGRCELCGTSENLSVHHILGIEIALKFYPEISHAAIRSLANALCVCSHCHEHMDRQAKINHSLPAQSLKRALGEQPALV